MQATVLVPMTFAGLRISTRGNLAVCSKRACAEIAMPGAMIPPIHSPLRLTVSKFVAVPKSTTTQGPPYFSNAATPFTMRSAPTSDGLSHSTGIPVLMPGSTNSGLRWKYSSQTLRSVQSSGGTTDEIMMPLTSATSTLPMAKRLRKSTPYSSTVWVLMVATRQCATSRGAEFLPEIPGMFISYTPSTVLVLPTSRTNSIRSPQQRPHAAGYDDPQTFVGADAEKAARIQAVGYAAETAVLIHMYQLTVCVGRTRLHALDDRLKTKIRGSYRAGDGAHQGAIFAIESPHQRAYQLRARPLLARLNT